MPEPVPSSSRPDSTPVPRRKRRLIPVAAIGAAAVVLVASSASASGSIHLTSIGAQPEDARPVHAEHAQPAADRDDRRPGVTAAREHLARRRRRVLRLPRRRQPVPAHDAGRTDRGPEDGARQEHLPGPARPARRRPVVSLRTPLPVPGPRARSARLHHAHQPRCRSGAPGHAARLDPGRDREPAGRQPARHRRLGLEPVHEDPPVQLRGQRDVDRRHLGGHAGLPVHGRRPARPLRPRRLRGHRRRTTTATSGSSRTSAARTAPPASASRRTSPSSPTASSSGSCRTTSTTSAPAASSRSSRSRARTAIPVTFTGGDNPTQAQIDADVTSAFMRDVHTYGNSFDTTWVTIHDTAVDGTATFNANSLAKAKGGTPFKRPENGQFRPARRLHRVLLHRDRRHEPAVGRERPVGRLVRRPGAASCG